MHANLQSLECGSGEHADVHTSSAAVFTVHQLQKTAPPRVLPQVADEYGSEAYRGAIDLTVHDPTGKQIHHANAIQDDEISVDAHGVKVGL